MLINRKSHISKSHNEFVVRVKFLLSLQHKRLQQIMRFEAKIGTIKRILPKARTVSY